MQNGGTRAGRHYAWLTMRDTLAVSGQTLTVVTGRPPPSRDSSVGQSYLSEWLSSAEGDLFIEAGRMGFRSWTG